MSGTRNAIAGLVVDFGVDVVADARYNLNTTLWLTQSDAAPTDLDPQDVTTEVMVRFNDASLTAITDPSSTSRWS